MNRRIPPGSARLQPGQIAQARLEPGAPRKAIPGLRWDVFKNIQSNIPSIHPMI
jgi:hypothetical protein